MGWQFSKRVRNFRRWIDGPLDPAGLPESQRNKGSNNAAPTPPYAGPGLSIVQPVIDVKNSSDGQIQGFYALGLGKAYLIADNVSANDMPAVMVLEIGVHAASDSTSGLPPLSSNRHSKAHKNAHINFVRTKLSAAQSAGSRPKNRKAQDDEQWLRNATQPLTH